MKIVARALLFLFLAPLAYSLSCAEVPANDICIEGEGAAAGGVVGTVPMSGPVTCPVPKSTPVTDVPGSPRDGGARLHKGIDLTGPRGTPIRAPLDGKVAFISDNSGGLCVNLDHGIVGGKRLQTLYCHLDSCSVSEGQFVPRGAAFATLGRTGIKNSPAHLHFEVWSNGQRDPVAVLPFWRSCG